MSSTMRLRSDLDIQSDVLDELNWTANVKANEIGVAVSEGVVTLTGTVESYLARQAAQDAALRVRGVHAVANEIDVRLHTSAERTDSDLALAICNALKWDAAIPTDQLDVAVSHGFVTLKGQVEWYYQREAAARVVQRLAGVKGVNNLVTVAAHPAPADIKQRIERAMVRNAEVDADSITVSVEGNVAVLRGKVRSYAEKVAAGRTAWLAPGIVTVDNKIEITYDD
ncbi:MAG: BON domain-containing protein [Ktedonobacterales bacterium]